MSRAEGLEAVDLLVRSAWLLGWLSARELGAAWGALGQMRSGSPEMYTQGVRQLTRVLEWARAGLMAELGAPLLRYQAVEAGARGVLDDQLRGSVMLPLAAVLDRLVTDAERVRGGGHRLLGMPGVSTASLRGENPGLCVGTLQKVSGHADIARLKRTDVALLEDLPPELPPVAGIVTVGAAGSLSHVSLLARNLGIPHATVGGGVAHALAKLNGQSVIVGVSSGRRVVLGLASALPAACPSGRSRPTGRGSRSKRGLRGAAAPAHRRRATGPRPNRLAALE
jgi:hypothetical protein